MDNTTIGFDGSNDGHVVVLARTPDGGWRITGDSPGPAELAEQVADLITRHNRPVRRWNEDAEPGTEQPGLAEQVRAWMAENTPELDLDVWQQHILELAYQHTGPVLTGPVYTPRRNTLGQHIARSYSTAHE